MPPPAPDPVVRFETEPGQQMQADWASDGRARSKLKVFIATLGWSRAAYVEFCDNERVETLIGCHENAIAGLRRRAPRSALRQHAHGRNRAQHLWTRRAPLPWRLPRLCSARGLPATPVLAVSRPDQGKVERFIGYLKRSFWIPFFASMRQVGLKPDKHLANAAVARWLREVANARVHATIAEVPAERLMIEAPKLQTLPAPYGEPACFAAPFAPRPKQGTPPPPPYLPPPFPGGPSLQHDRIVALAAELRLTALPDLYGSVAQAAAKKKRPSYADFLEDVLRAEREARRVRAREMLTRTAGFPALKTLEAYDFGVRNWRPARPDPGAGFAGLRRAGREYRAARARARARRT